MRRSGPVALALCALLPACGRAGSTIHGEQLQTFYHPALVSYVARDGHMPLAVYGEPFRAGGGAAAQLQRELRLPGGLAAVPFAATPAAQAGEGGRVVLVFDPAARVGGDAICRLRDAPPGPSGAELRVLAAFCYGDEAASEIRMTTARPSSAADPAFRQAMQTMLARLLPLRAPNQTGDCPPADRC
jgi:hypothetical protein